MSPWAPKRPCTGGPSCPHFAGECPVHGKRPWEHGRPNSAARGYGHRWRRLRELVLARDGKLCQVCLAGNKLTPAHGVDHIIPRARGGKDELENLRAICKDCHDRKSGREGREARR